MLVYMQELSVLRKMDCFFLKKTTHRTFNTVTNALNLVNFILVSVLPPTWFSPTTQQQRRFFMDLIWDCFIPHAFYSLSTSSTVLVCVCVRTFVLSYFRSLLEKSRSDKNWRRNLWKPRHKYTHAHTHDWRLNLEGFLFHTCITIV